MVIWMPRTTAEFEFLEPPREKFSVLVQVIETARDCIVYHMSRFCCS